MCPLELTHYALKRWDCRMVSVHAVHVYIETLKKGQPLTGCGSQHSWDERTVFIGWVELLVTCSLSVSAKVRLHVPLIHQSAFLAFLSMLILALVEELSDKWLWQMGREKVSDQERSGNSHFPFVSDGIPGNIFRISYKRYTRQCKNLMGSAQISREECWKSLRDHAVNLLPQNTQVLW